MDQTHYTPPQKTMADDNSPKKLFIKTWGCQMNAYDTKRMADVLRPLGYGPTDNPADADFIILNTCHIREKATEKVFSDLGRLRAHKNARTAEGKQTLMAVAGCVAQAEGDVITDRAPYVDLVLGPQTYHRLPEMVAELTGAYGDKRLINTDFPVESKFDHLPQEETTASGPMAFVAIQEGCDKFCTFCVVPYTRGAEFSRPATQILTEIKALVAAGAVEIQLLGQNVNAYHGQGPDGTEWSLARLIYAVAEIDGVHRIRYTTSHPRDMRDDLVQAHRDVPQLMPFLHLPVQSGSNSILQAMNRKHTTDEFLRYIDAMREARPDMAFSSDFIVGFPGETDQDFADTLALIERVGFASAYTFGYSPRPGTPAAVLQNQIHPAIINHRLKEIQSAIGHQQLTYNQSFIGQTIDVLVERVQPPSKKTPKTQLQGRSPYMQSTFIDNVPEATLPHLVGRIVPVHIKGAFPMALNGTIIVDNN